MKALWFAVLVLVSVVVYGVVTRTIHADPPTVRTVALERGPMSSSIRVTGIVSTTRNVVVASTVDGRAKAVSVEVGDTVARGEAVVTLDRAQMIQQVAVQEAAVGLLHVEIANQSRMLASLRADFHAGGETRESVLKAEDELRTQRARLRQAMAELRLSRLKLSEYTLKAPITGTVIDVRVRAGESVREGQPLLTVAQTSDEQILAKVEPVDALQVHVGMPAIVTVDGAPSVEMKEHVVRIEPSIQKESGADFLAVWISHSSSAAKLRLNQQVDVRLTMDQRSSVVRMPLDALVTRNGKALAWVVENGRIHSVPIETGIFGDHYVEVKSGLHVGQTVAIPEGKALKDGDKVHIASTRTTS